MKDAKAYEGCALHKLRSLRRIYICRKATPKFCPLGQTIITRRVASFAKGVHHFALANHLSPQGAFLLYIYARKGD